MAAYPTVGQQASINPAESRVMTIAVNGAPRIREYHTTQYFDILVIHPYCTDAEAVSITDFYDANKDSWNTWTDIPTADQYSILIIDRPLVQHQDGPWYRVESRFRGKLV